MTVVEGYLSSYTCLLNGHHQTLHILSVKRVVSQELLCIATVYSSLMFNDLFLSFSPLACGIRIGGKE